MWAFIRRLMLWRKTTSSDAKALARSTTSESWMCFKTPPQFLFDAFDLWSSFSGFLVEMLLFVMPFVQLLHCRVNSWFSLTGRGYHSFRKVRVTPYSRPSASKRKQKRWQTKPATRTCSWRRASATACQYAGLRSTVLFVGFPRCKSPHSFRNLRGLAICR